MNFFRLVLGNVITLPLRFPISFSVKVGLGGNACDMALKMIPIVLCRRNDDSVREYGFTQGISGSLHRIAFWDEVDCLSLVLRLTGACFKIQVLEIMVTARGQPRSARHVAILDIYTSERA